MGMMCVTKPALHDIVYCAVVVLSLYLHVQNHTSARAERRANANKTDSAPGTGGSNPNHCLPTVRGYKFAERPPVRKVVCLLEYTIF